MDWLSENQFPGDVLDALTAGICVLDHNGTIVAANATWRQSSNDNHGPGFNIGANYPDILRRASGQGSDARHRFGDAVMDVLAGKGDRFEMEYPWRVTGERRWFLARVTLLLRSAGEAGGGSGMAAVISHQNVTARKSLEMKLKKLAETDELTGLTNRRKFMSIAATALDRTKRDNTPASLVLLDLDHFKKINDTHGHAAGNDALRFAARRLKRTLRRRDVLARIGGEEFAVLLPNTDEWGATILAERMRCGIEVSKINAGAGSFDLTASFGVTSFRSDDRDPGEVLARADKALYLAKEAGRNRVRASYSGDPRPRQHDYAGSSSESGA